MRSLSAVPGVVGCRAMDYEPGFTAHVMVELTYGSYQPTGGTVCCQSQHTPNV